MIDTIENDNTSVDFATLDPRKDPMGAAILDYIKYGRAGRLRVKSSMFEDDFMPVNHLFRTYEAMPRLEQMALDMTQGRVLDVGAGSGCHSLVLQKRGMDVKSIDISPLSCEAMRCRGLEDVECINLFDSHLSAGYDTILLLMNGTGIAGKADRLPRLFLRLKSLLNPGGQILVDSSDLKYIYETDDGSYDLDPEGPYYGEVDYQMVYEGTRVKLPSGAAKRGGMVRGESFDWLYTDFVLLKTMAEGCGLHCERVAEGPHFDYLARLIL